MLEHTMGSDRAARASERMRDAGIVVDGEKSLPQQNFLMQLIEYLKNIFTPDTSTSHSIVQTEPTMTVAPKEAAPTQAHSVHKEPSLEKAVHEVRKTLEERKVILATPDATNFIPNKSTSQKGFQL
jgi:hypothetical protein